MSGLTVVRKPGNPFESFVNSMMLFPVLSNTLLVSHNMFNIKPLQDLERSLRRAQKVISTDDRLSGSPLMKVLYGDPTSILDLPTQEATDHSTFWSCPERVTIERFTQILEQDKGQEDSPVLWLFLKKVLCSIALLL